jgi:hypothetical protein
MPFSTISSASLCCVAAAVMLVASAGYTDVVASIGRRYGRSCALEEAYGLNEALPQRRSLYNKSAVRVDVVGGVVPQLESLVESSIA